MAWLEGKRIQETRFSAKICIGVWIMGFGDFFVFGGNFPLSYKTPSPANCALQRIRRLIVLVRLDKTVFYVGRGRDGLAVSESTYLLHGVDAHLETLANCRPIFFCDKFPINVAFK